MDQYILYQAYGNEKIICECKYALLRLFDVYNSASLKPPPIVVYTDDPSHFSIFLNHMEISIENLDQKKISLWKGKINFVHRVKIAVIQDCLAKHGGKLFYMDTDTYLLQTLDVIFNGIQQKKVFFHANEGNIAKLPNFKKWRAFLKTVPGNVLIGANAMHTDMWNAGTIGLDKSHIFLVQKVLKITDEVYPLFPRHTVEQFAFCQVFQQEGISFYASEPFVFHYWRLKEFRVFLQTFFNIFQHAAFLGLVEKSRAILPQQFLLEKIKYEEGSKIRKFWQKLIGKSWVMPIYKADKTAQ